MRFIRPSILATATCLLAVLLGACGKKPAQPAPVDHKKAPLLDPRFGALSRIPETADFFVAAYDLSAVEDKLLQSQFVAGILSNPIVAPQLKQANLPSDAPGLFSAALAQSPDLTQGHQTARDLIGREVFFYMPRGAASAVEKLQTLIGTIRLVQLESTLAVMTTSGAQQADRDKMGREMVAAIVSRVEPLFHELEVPPFLAGFKAPELKDAFQARKEELRKQIPPNITQQKWLPAPGSTELDRLVIEGSAVLTPELEQQVSSALDALAAESGDPTLTQRVIDTLKKRRIEFAFGYDGDYLLFACAANLDALTLAPDPASSLAASERLAPLHPFAGPTTHAISYASEAFAMNAAVEIRLATLLDAVRPYLTSVLPAEEIGRLSDELARLDARASEFLPSKATEACSILNIGKGLRVESFGGAPPFLYAADVPRALSARRFPNAAVFFAGASDKPAIKALFTWVSDLAALVHGAFEKHVLPQLPDADVRQFKTVEAVFLPKITTAYELIRQFSVDIIGPDSAFVLDFEGTLPAVEPVPAPFQGAAGVPRVGLIWSLADSARLLPWADKLTKLANDLAAFAPPDSGLPIPLPALQPRIHADSTSYVVPLPLDLADSHPAAIVSKTGFLTLTTSPSLANPMISGPTTQEPAPAAEFIIRFKPITIAAKTWMDFAQTHKQMLFSGQPDKLAEFETNLPALREFANTLERLEGFRSLLDKQSGVWHRTFEFGQGALGSN